MAQAANNLTRFAQRTRQLYTLPAVAVEILALADDPRVDCQKLKACIERDPALVGKILRVVNSSLFGLGSNVANLNQAVALLGIKSLKLLVLGFSLSETMFADRTGPAMQHAWRHTLTRAVAARELCETLWKVPGDESFLAALLAELGKFVLFEELGDPYVRVVEAARADGGNLAVLEQHSLGFNHLQLSAEMLAYWGLPASLVGSLRLAAAPSELARLEPPELYLPAAVYYAGLLADLLVDGRSESLHELLVNPAHERDHRTKPLDQLRVAERQLEFMLPQVGQRVADLAQALSFELPTGQDYRDILVEAHRRLSQESIDAACLLARQLPLADKRGAEVAQLSATAARYLNQSRQLDHAAPPPAMPRGSFAEPQSRGASAAIESIQQTTATKESPKLSALHRQLNLAVAIARDSRRPLSLLLAEVADSDVSVVARLCQAADQPHSMVVLEGESRLAILLPDCERHTAVALAQQLLREARRLPKTPRLGLGIATATVVNKHFAPQVLLDAATRCLGAAQLSGGNTLKSIDV
jgi:HD-like signal output (HDOD) protein